MYQAVKQKKIIQTPAQTNILVEINDIYQYFVWKQEIMWEHLCSG